MTWGWFSARLLDCGPNDRRHRGERHFNNTATCIGEASLSSTRAGQRDEPHSVRLRTSPSRAIDAKRSRYVGVSTGSLLRRRNERAAWRGKTEATGGTTLPNSRKDYVGAAPSFSHLPPHTQRDISASHWTDFTADCELS